MKDEKTKDILLLLSILILLTGVMLIFSETTSPLSTNVYGDDSAYYRFIGSSILKGKTLYTDIWDNKGPVLYLIQALGAIHGTRNEKLSFIFPMQIVSLMLSIFLMNRIDREFSTEGKRNVRFFLLTVCTIILFNTVIAGGNLTEEWSIPMICFSLLLFTKYAVHAEQDPVHPAKHAFFHGICLTLVAFIRINNAITIVTGIVVIGIYLGIRKQWRSLLENLLAGMAGVILISVPIFVYFVRKHALYDMLYAVFIYNFKYMQIRTHTGLSANSLLGHYLPMAVSFMLILIHFVRYHRFRFIDILAFIITLTNTLLLLKTNGYNHYFAIYVPVYFYILILYVRFNKPAAELLVSLALISLFIKQNSDIAKAIFWRRENITYTSAAGYVPKSERESVFPIYLSSSIYINSGLFPLTRFAAYQHDFLSINPEFMDEFKTKLLTAEPKWIIASCDTSVLFPEARNLIESQYSCQFSDVYGCYYRIQDNGDK